MSSDSIKNAPRYESANAAVGQGHVFLGGLFILNVACLLVVLFLGTLPILNAIFVFVSFAPLVGLFFYLDKWLRTKIEWLGQITAVLFAAVCGLNVVALVISAYNIIACILDTLGVASTSLSCSDTDLSNAVYSTIFQVLTVVITGMLAAYVRSLLRDTKLAEENVLRRAIEVERNNKLRQQELEEKLQAQRQLRQMRLDVASLQKQVLSTSGSTT